MIKNKFLLHAVQRLGIALIAYIALWLFTFGEIQTPLFLTACCLFGAIDTGVWIDNNLPKNI